MGMPAPQIIGGTNCDGLESRAPSVRGEENLFGCGFRSAVGREASLLNGNAFVDIHQGHRIALNYGACADHNDLLDRRRSDCGFH
jgi:hypothetical protein